VIYQDAVAVQCAWTTNKLINIKLGNIATIVIKEERKKMEKEIFETSDLATIAILELNDFQIREITGDKKKFAIFDNTIKLQKVVDDFILGKLRVEPLEFFNQIRTTRYKLINSR
jgi:hypothetical protein